MGDELLLLEHQLEQRLVGVNVCVFYSLVESDPISAVNGLQLLADMLTLAHSSLSFRLPPRPPRPASLLLFRTLGSH